MARPLDCLIAACSDASRSQSGHTAWLFISSVKYQTGCLRIGGVLAREPVGPSARSHEARRLSYGQREPQVGGFDPDRCGCPFQRASNLDECLLPLMLTKDFDIARIPASKSFRFLPSCHVVCSGW